MRKAWYSLANGERIIRLFQMAEMERLFGAELCRHARTHLESVRI